MALSESISRCRHSNERSTSQNPLGHSNLNEGHGFKKVQTTIHCVQLVDSHLPQNPRLEMEKTPVLVFDSCPSNIELIFMIVLSLIRACIACLKTFYLGQKPSF